jgi:excisionase family DNA binding protein
VLVADLWRMPANATVEKRLLTTREVAERLSVSIFTVRHFAERGVLPVVRFTPTSRLRFRPEDVERLACLGGREESR